MLMSFVKHCLPRRRTASAWRAAALALLVGFAPGREADASSLEDLSRLNMATVRRIGPYTELSDKQILSLKQDAYGFLWIATVFELYRFDGTDFVDYTPKFRLPQNQLDQLAMDIFEDSQGNLWIGCKRNLYRYDRERDDIELIEGVGSAEKIVEDPFGRLYVFSIQGELRIYRYRNGQLLEESPHDNFAELQRDERFAHIVFDALGTGYLSSLKGKIFRLSATPHDCQLSKEEPIQLTAERPFEVTQCKLDGRWLWVGSDPMGLFRIDLAKGEISRYLRRRGSASFSIEGNRIAWIRKDSDQRLWVGLFDGGMNLYLPEGDRFLRFTYAKGRVVEEGRLAPSSIEFDPNGNIWIGTRDVGIFLVNSNPSFLLYESLLDEDFDYSTASIYAYLESRDGTQWIGIRGEGLCRKKPGQQLERGLFPGSGLNRAYFMEEDPQGNIWAHTFEGVAIIDPRQDQISFFHPEPATHAEPGAILMQDQSIWIGGDQGLVRLDLETRETIDRVTDLGGSPRYLHLDPSGRLWIACRKRLNVYDTRNKRMLESEWKDITDKRAFVEHRTTGVKTLPDGSAWVSVFGQGLMLLDPNLKIVKTFEAQDGLPSEAIESFDIDNQGVLWMGTRMGLVTFDPKNQEIEQYLKEDGLADNRFNVGDCSRARDGAIVFKTFQGLLRVYPKIKPMRPRALEARLTDLRILGKEVPIGAKEGPLDRSILLADSLTLESHQNIVTFSFTGLNYSKMGKAWYRWRLNRKGEASWSAPTQERTATIANLQPGTYLWELQASSNPRHWDGPSRSLSITVLPSIWTRWWMIALMTASAGGIIYLAVTVRTRSLNRKRLALQGLVDERNREILAKNAQLEAHRDNLEATVEERTRDLRIAKERAEESERLKDSFLANMSHEIRTPLNAIVGLSQVMSHPELRDEKRMPQFAEIIEENAFKLAHLIDDIIDVSRLDSGTLRLKPFPFDLVSVCRELFAEYRVKMNKISSPVDLRLESTDLPQLMVVADQERVRQIIHSFLENAVKFTKEGRIVLHLRASNEEAIVSVSDTGIGIAQKHQESVFDRFRKLEDETSELYRGTGLGLAVSRKLAELMGGRIELKSELGQGSTFSLHLPKNSG